MKKKYSLARNRKSDRKSVMSDRRSDESTAGFITFSGVF
jgi:hypothetical protein